MTTAARTKLTALGYIRVSTPSQEVDEQVRVIRQYADEHGIEIIEQYGDYQKRHKADQRRSFQAMLMDIATLKPNMILVQRLDRFGTNGPNQLGEFLEKLKKLKVKLVTVIDGMKEHCGKRGCGAGKYMCATRTFSFGEPSTTNKSSERTKSFADSWFFSEFRGNEAGHSCLLGWPPAHDATSCRRFRGVHAATVDRIRANPGAAPCSRESTGETLTAAKTGAGAKLGVAPFHREKRSWALRGRKPNEGCPGCGCAKVHPAAGGVTSPAAVFFAIALDTCAMPPKIPRRQTR